MKIAVIPARGESKRIHRKNIRDFCGKPIIAYSIERALKSELFDRVIVSTDDQEIAAQAQNMYEHNIERGNLFIDVDVLASEFFLILIFFNKSPTGLFFLISTL